MENIELTWVAVVTLFLNAVAVFFTGFQSYQNRKAQFIQITEDFRNRYAQLIEERKEVDHLYHDPQFDLQKLKEKDVGLYNELVHSEKKFYWYCFDQWYLGHVDKTAPRHLKNDWDYSTKVSVNESVHRQSWEQIFKTKDFRGHKKFNEFINGCIQPIER